MNEQPDIEIRFESTVRSIDLERIEDDIKQVIEKHTDVRATAYDRITGNSVSANKGGDA